MTEGGSQWGEAKSFTEKDKPDGLQEVYSITKGFPCGQVEFIFYKDVTGELYYESKHLDKKSPA